VTPPPPADLVAALRSGGCVWAEDEAAVLLGCTSDPEQLWDLARRRIAGEPLEQVVGWAAFCGLRIPVEPGVFVPRRRSEPLAQLAAAEAVRRAPAVVVDLCCGAGALGAAVVSIAGGQAVAELHAADIDAVAVRLAARTVAPYGGQAHVGDLFDALPPGLRGRVDVLVVNAPYVPTAALATLPAEARDHEPRAALDGGPDGVDLHRRVAAGAPAWLGADGVVLIETSFEQADRTIAALVAAGLVAGAIELPEGDPGVVVAWGSRAGESDAREAGLRRVLGQAAGNLGAAGGARPQQPAAGDRDRRADEGVDEPGAGELDDLA
jgi:release factor glutamine methyltransferase